MAELDYNHLFYFIFFHLFIFRTVYFHCRSPIYHFLIIIVYSFSHNASQFTYIVMHTFSDALIRARIYFSYQMSLKTKNVFLTGGAQGLGKSYVDALLGEGARVR